jgi:hypothetical protein
MGDVSPGMPNQAQRSAAASSATDQRRGVALPSSERRHPSFFITLLGLIRQACSKAS